MNARLLHITPSMPWGAEPDNTIERTAQDLMSGCADLHVYIARARSTHDALRLRAIINQCVLSLAAAEDAALMAADRLCGQPDLKRGA